MREKQKGEALWAPPSRYYFTSSILVFFRERNLSAIDPPTPITAPAIITPAIMTMGVATVSTSVSLTVRSFTFLFQILVSSSMICPFEVVVIPHSKPCKFCEDMQKRESLLGALKNLSLCGLRSRVSRCSARPCCRICGPCGVGSLVGAAYASASSMRCSERQTSQRTRSRTRRQPCFRSS